MSIAMRLLFAAIFAVSFGCDKLESMISTASNTPSQPGVDASPADASGLYRAKLKGVTDALTRLQVVLEARDLERSREIRMHTENVIAETRIAEPSLTDQERQKESYQTLQLAINHLERLGAVMDWFDEQERQADSRSTDKSRKTAEEFNERAIASINLLNEIQKKNAEAEAEFVFALGCVSGTLQQINEGK